MTVIKMVSEQPSTADYAPLIFCQGDYSPDRGSTGYSIVRTYPLKVADGGIYNSSADTQHKQSKQRDMADTGAYRPIINHCYKWVSF